MNIFYAPPAQVSDHVIELKGQEAAHAIKALRYKKGDAISVVDGQGGWYEGEVALVAKNRLQVAVHHSEKQTGHLPSLSLALGIIKKRDRLEFAVEKAVELGAGEIILFRGDHSVKQNVRVDRLESIILSAMKQSLQSWLPSLHVFTSLQDVTNRYSSHKYLVAHQQGERLSAAGYPSDQKERYLLFVGPEGGLSDKELACLKERGGQLVRLNSNRLRAETAAVSFLSLCRGK